MFKEQSQIKKPAIVAKAIWLMCVSLGIVLVSALWLSFYNPILAQNGFFTLLIMAWLTYKTNQGRNWARITFLVLYIIGIIVSIPIFLKSPFSITNLGIYILHAILQVIALIMLFSRKARPWFQPTAGSSATSGNLNSNA
ncbi:MAG TPA: hypothetical protein VFC85_03695 [Verrucomicrobiae bacterium]|nr:hypothetical protein [Verrucomicrobiae bacterium]